MMDRMESICSERFTRLLTIKADRAEVKAFVDYTVKQQMTTVVEMMDLFQQQIIALAQEVEQLKLRSPGDHDAADPSSHVQVAVAHLQPHRHTATSGSWESQQRLQHPDGSSADASTCGTPAGAGSARSSAEGGEHDDPPAACSCDQEHEAQQAVSSSVSHASASWELPESCVADSQACSAGMVEGQEAGGASGSQNLTWAASGSLVQQPAAGYGMQCMQATSSSSISTPIATATGEASVASSAEALCTAPAAPGAPGAPTASTSTLTGNDPQSAAVVAHAVSSDEAGHAMRRLLQQAVAPAAAAVGVHHLRQPQQAGEDYRGWEGMGLAEAAGGSPPGAEHSEGDAEEVIVWRGPRQPQAASPTGAEEHSPTAMLHEEGTGAVTASGDATTADCYRDLDGWYASSAARLTAASCCSPAPSRQPHQQQPCTEQASPPANPRPPSMYVSLASAAAAASTTTSTSGRDCLGASTIAPSAPAASAPPHSQPWETEQATSGRGLGPEQCTGSSWQWPMPRRAGGGGSSCSEASCGSSSGGAPWPSPPSTPPTVHALEALLEAVERVLQAQPPHH